MNPPSTFAEAFAGSLLDPGRAEPSCVAGPAGSPVAKRYAVYRNNVASSLVNAMADIYPATRRIAGDAFFRSMALVYVRTSPPRSRVLSEYGQDFPAFVEAFDPARRMPYLADVARLERAWLDAYHAADAEPLAPHALAALAPDRLERARFDPHPAMRVIRSRYAVVSIFEANRKEAATSTKIRGDQAEDALVTRPRVHVEVRHLAPGTAAFLTDLAQGHRLAQAVERALARESGFDAGQAIALMLEAGAFAAILQD